MKLVKGSYFSGYVKIEILGEQPEHFLEVCSSNGIMLWEIKKTSEDSCTAMIQLRDVKEVKRLRYSNKYKIRFSNRYGIPFLNKKAKRKKPLLYGLLLSVLLFFFLSNMIWKVSITGVPEELENKISESLISYGVHPGAFTFRLASPNQIQQLLLEDVPELLWVGVEKKGTSFYLEGVEKLIIKDEEPKSPRHLIANKNGVIKSMYVKRGLPKVSVNNFVEKGEVLVSGSIEKYITEDKEEDNQAYELVAAEGEVIATTWYQAEVTIPLETAHIELTGNVEENYRLKIGSFSLPIWPWHTNTFTNEVKEIDEKNLKIFNWESPVSFVVDRRLESYSNQAERTREEAIQIGIQQAKEDLIREIGQDVQIITEKVLHERIEHGKVKLSLHITVEENIAIEEPINQGD